MNRPASRPRHALVVLAALAALAAAPSTARAVIPGTATARRALAATLAGDGHRHEIAPRARRSCPESMPPSAGGRLTLSVERQLARWGESAQRWAKERVAIAVYVADVTGLTELADRLTDENA